MALDVANHSGTSGFARKVTRRAHWHVEMRLRVAAWLFYVRFGALTIACLAARNRCWACTNFGVLSVPVGTGLTCGDSDLPAAVRDLNLRLLAATHLTPLRAQDMF